MNSEQLTQEVKALAKQHGAMLVGVASIDRFDPMPPYYDRAPRGQHPCDFVPDAKGVISIAQPILDQVLDAPARLADEDLEMIPPDVRRPYLELVYDITGHAIQDRMLEFISQILGQFLQTHAHDAMIFPTTGVHPHIPGLTKQQMWEGPSKAWADRNSPFRYSSGPFSHRHAATRAGLGEFGYNNVVLTPEYGPRQRFNSIITNAELVADPLITEPICLRDDCNRCHEVCTLGAITMRDDQKAQDYRTVESVDSDVIFIDTPAKSNAPLCMSRRERQPDLPIRGDCIRICPIPKKRKSLPERLR